jgi:hypothetical protein
VLFLHETHKVVGAREDEFEAAYREGWVPTLAEDDDARLLWYTNLAHGSGASYTVVTITGITDGAAWESLARRTQTGDLRPWMRELDDLRHDVTGKILLPVEWSPLQQVDLSSVPTDGTTHQLSLFMEDTGWPYAPLDDYIRMWDEIYYRPLSKTPDSRHPGVFPGGARQLQATRSDALAEDLAGQRLRDAGPLADHRHPA